MIAAYKEHIQFIILLVAMYILGVWVDPVIYGLFPLVLIVLGLKKRFFELLICAIWILILSDYVPLSNATFQDLQFAKDLKPIVPILLTLFMITNRDLFRPFPKFVFYFIPFFVIAGIGLIYSLDFGIGIRKTISFVLMYSMVPIYVNMLARDQKKHFWISLFTYLIGMLAIGIVLGVVLPEIAILEGGSRFKGIFGNPNGLGIFLNLTFIMWIVLEEFKLVQFSKGERWFTLFILIVSLLWCGSRNGIMSILLFYFIHKAVKINWFVGVITITVFVSFSSLISDSILTVVSFFDLDGYFRVESIEEGSGRQVAWLFAWSEIQNYYFFGGGFGHDEHIMRPNYYWLRMEGHDGGVHNSYLSMWFNVGIIGVIFYFGALIRIYLKSFKHSHIVIAFAVSMFFNITYESWIVASLNPFTIMFLVLLTILGQNLRGESYETLEEENERIANFKVANG